MICQNKKDIFMVALIRSGEKHIFYFDMNHVSELLRTLGKYASNPELNLTWHDAAFLSQKVQNIKESNASE